MGGGPPGGARRRRPAGVGLVELSGATPGDDASGPGSLATVALGDRADAGPPRGSVGAATRHQMSDPPTSAASPRVAPARASFRPVRGVVAAFMTAVPVP